MRHSCRRGDTIRGYAKQGQVRDLRLCAELSAEQVECHPLALIVPYEWTSNQPSDCFGAGDAFERLA
jgi:hypothetical protein